MYFAWKLYFYVVKQNILKILKTGVFSFHKILINHAFVAKNKKHAMTNKLKFLDS